MKIKERELLIYIISEEIKQNELERCACMRINSEGLKVYAGRPYVERNARVSEKDAFTSNVSAFVCMCNE